MKAEIGPDEVLGFIRQALEAKYGDKFDLSDIDMQVKRPKGKKTEVAAIVELKEKLDIPDRVAQIRNA